MRSVVAAQAAFEDDGLLLTGEWEEQTLAQVAEQSSHSVLDRFVTAILDTRTVPSFLNLIA